MKKPSVAQLAKQAKAVMQAQTADDFAAALAKILGESKGGLIWVETRAMWKLLEQGVMSREQLLSAIARRHCERINLVLETMRAQSKAMSDSQ